MELSWTRDLTAETNLVRLGIEFEIGTIKWSQIDLKESQVNGARIGDPIVKPLIDDYYPAMLAGDSFPMIVVHFVKGRWVVLSGIQRTATIANLIKDGHLPEDPPIECYTITDCDPLSAESFARSANVFHGGRSERPERLQQAIYCVRKLGIFATDAARLFNVTEYSINQHVRAEKLRDDLAKQGVDTSRLPIGVLDAMSRIDGDENAQRNLAVIVAQHDLPIAAVKSVCNELRAASGHQERTAIIKGLEKELAAQAKAVSSAKKAATKAPKRPRRDTFMRYLENTAAFLEKGNDGQSFTSMDQLQFTGNGDTSRAKQLAGKIRFVLDVLGL